MFLFSSSILDVAVFVRRKTDSRTEKRKTFTFPFQILLTVSADGTRFTDIVSVDFASGPSFDVNWYLPEDQGTWHSLVFASQILAKWKGTRQSGRVWATLLGDHSGAKQDHSSPKNEGWWTAMHAWQDSSWRWNWTKHSFCLRTKNTMIGLSIEQLMCFFQVRICLFWRRLEHS